VSTAAGGARATVARLGTSALGSRPVSFLASRVLPGLRVLAYHDVPRPDVFRSHLVELGRGYRPVGADEVIAALRDGRPLPRRAVWVTFDDGHPSTLHAAADLAAAGVPATVFVCPAVVDTTEPLWWQIVDEALRRGVVPLSAHGGDVGRFRAELKTSDDPVRRAAVEACRAALDSSAEGPLRVVQATTADLEAWIGYGHHVGNHTWDHPLLDRCDEAAQETQIGSAHEWLRERFPTQPAVFAYPNGNSTAYAEKVAIGLGYEVRTLFDHRIATRLAADTAVSRLRIDADAALPRFRSITSGAHAHAFRIVG
jgi:peptidoglycan/xylan/chitin deacetylase (PgdA/CDA1 family)